MILQMFLHKNNTVNINVSVIKLFHDLLGSDTDDHLRMFLINLTIKLTLNTATHDQGLLSWLSSMQYDMNHFHRQLMEMKDSNQLKHTQF